MGDENRELHYIYAATGIAAIMQRSGSVDSMFYVHPDHLGSLVLITDENGDVYEEKSFDAFGRLRDPEDWSEIVTEGNYRFDRGFTGHEHLEAFGLINMNWRMYDPHTARFLSPDLFVQDPAFTQSFNRYSYCLNNPLRFVDPGGYWWNGLTDRVFHDGQTDWSRVVHAQKRHQDGGSGGYSYDPSSPTGYRNSSGDEVSWWEVYHSYILPNAVRGVTIGVEEYYYQGRGTQFGNDAIRVNPNGNLHVWAVFTSTFYGVVGFPVNGGDYDWRPQYNLDAAITALNNNAQPKSVGYCARYVRTALEAGGLNTSGRPGSAADYDGYLPTLGFNSVSSTNYTPQRGDIVVFNRFNGHQHGHIQMYNGSQWVSDFRQSDFWPGSSYLTIQPNYTIFRW